MLADVSQWFDSAAEALAPNRDWMVVNLALAAVPLFLSFVLFRWCTRRRSLWWLGAVAFVVFLPNAPYVLTDVIHLIEQIESGAHPASVVALVLLPIYAAVILLAFEAYVLSLLNVERYLRAIGRPRLVPVVEIVLHAASAVGIFLGRFERLNSWSVVTRLDSFVGTIIDNSLERRPLAVIAVTFVAIVILYRIAKWLTLAVVSYPPPRRVPFGGVPPSTGSHR
jgi:uncharacterized membrane protein